MTVEAECILQASMGSLARATAFVDTFCGRHGVAPDDALRLTLIVEELFTNTVMHGHGGDCDRPVRLALGAGTAELSLVYEDEAPAFDPRSASGAPDPGPDAGDGDRLGGLGLGLVSGLAAEFAYERAGDHNRVRVVLRRRA